MPLKSRDKFYLAYFKPVPIILFLLSSWITSVCASLLSFDESGNLIAHSYSVWGDWSAHFTFISALRERGIHWLSGDNPLFPGVPFQYPFLSHLITAVIAFCLGLDTIHAVYYLSLILMFALPFVLYRLFRELKLNEYPALASVMMFLLIGGFQWMDGSLNPRDPLTNQFDAASVFTQFILFEFFPQRAFLFGLIGFAGLLTITLKKKNQSLTRWIVTGIALATLALTHVHTWIAMGVLLLCYFIFPTENRDWKTRKNTLLFGIGVALLSSVFLWFLLLRNHSGSQSDWKIWYPGWAQNENANIPKARDMNPIVFWIFNTGVFLPLSFFGIWLKKNEPRLQAFALAGGTLFISALFFNLQPYYYDNLKLFTYSFFFFAPFAGIALAKITQLKQIPKMVGISGACILLALQIHSGTTDLISFQNGLQNTLFFSKEEFKLANDFKAIRHSADDLVLIVPKHNHWVPCLTGNPVVLGYEGWLWSWGINYEERDRQVTEILTGGPNAESFIKKLNVNYIAVAQGEKIGNQNINFSYLDAHYTKVLSGNVSVYAVK